MFSKFFATVACSLLILTAACVGFSCVSADQAEKQPFADKWFGDDISLTAESTWYRASRSGQPVGYIFRTDQVEPIVKGKRDQIVMMVAVDNKGTILGLEVISKKEDATYFNKIKPAFYDAFVGVDAINGPLPPKVTGATRSSEAIRKDISLAVQTIMSSTKETL